MLKQHLAETQQLPVITPPLPIAHVHENAEEETRTIARDLPPASRLFSPLYLSRRQIITGFIIPLAWASVMVGMQWLQASLFPSHQYNENWFNLHTILFVPLPIILCLCLGYYLRNLRFAAVIGTFAGIFFYLATRLDFRLVREWWFDLTRSFDVPRERMECHVLPLDIKGIATAMLLTTFLSVVAALLSKAKHGRRTMYDRDNNR